MAFNVNEMRAQLVGGGARPSLFQINISNPVSAVADLKLAFMAKAASLPARTLTSIPVSYFGRTIKFNGTTTYDTWQTTVINDEDFLVRNALEDWMSQINLAQQNITTLGRSPAAYKSQGEVVQYSKDGGILRKVQFYGLWPSNLGDITLAWENGDQIEEFTVQWEYDWWAVSGGQTGNGGGQ